jgi:Fe-S cluster assembly protein SufD
MTTNIFQNTAIENIQKTFNEQFNNAKGFSHLKDIKNLALNNFLKAGFPSKKSEQYKYTSLEQHFAGTYKYFPFSIEGRINVDEIFKCDVPNLDTHLIILINGWFYATSKQNLLYETNQGIIYGSLLEAINKYPEKVLQYIKLQNETNILDNLNMALMQDGLFVYIPKNTKLDKPIQVINLVVANEPVQIYPRHLFISESSNLTQILFCDHSLNASPFIMNGNINVILNKEAKLEFYRIQNAHNHSVQLTNNNIEQDEESYYKGIYITLHGGTVRNNINVNLNGTKATNEMYGLWLADKNQHIDYYTEVKHRKPNCQSNQFFKSILDDEATGIFSGKILVEKNAQKTNAYQSNKNLIISPKAKVRSKPHLEIYADDVKCSHGSATGKLDDDAMFYLRSRGISQKESCQLLMFAFASDITKQISLLPLKEEIDHLVNKRLRGELSRCNRCSITCC